jgi:diadenosine tetraphosphate (Ap4A) HIT family hydrolase
LRLDVQRIPKADALAIIRRDAEALSPELARCVMCAIARGARIPLHVLATNERAVAVLERFHVRRGHVLVVLKRHVEVIADLPWEEYAAVQRLAWEASIAIERALSPKRVFVAAFGAATALPMTFPHHHVHVVPLFDGGEGDRPREVFSWSQGVGVYEEAEATELAALLMRAWPPAWHLP